MRKIQVEQQDQGKTDIKVAVAAAAAGTLAIGMMVGLLERSNEGIQNHFDKQEQAAVEAITDNSERRTILAEGSTYRTAPITVNNNEDGGGKDTVAGKVPQGSVIRIINAPKYTDDEGQRWIAFNLEKDDAGHNTADIDKLYWANISELERQSDPESPFVSEFGTASTEAKGLQATDFTIGVHGGKFTTSHKEVGIVIGDAEIISNRQLINELAELHAPVIG